MENTKLPESFYKMRTIVGELIARRGENNTLLASQICLEQVQEYIGTTEAVEWALQAGLNLAAYIDQSQTNQSNEQLDAQSRRFTQERKELRAAIDRRGEFFQMYHRFVKKYTPGLRGKAKKGTKGNLRQAIERVCDSFGDKANLENVLRVFEGRADDVILDVIHSAENPFPIKVHDEMVERNKRRFYCSEANKKGYVSFKRIENLIRECRNNRTAS